MVCELKGKKRVRAQWQAAPKQITCVSANHPPMEQHYLTMKMHRTWRFLGCWRPNVLDKMQHWGWSKFCSSASSGISALGRLSSLVTLGFFVTSCTVAHFSLHCSWKEQFCFLLSSCRTNGWSGSQAASLYSHFIFGKSVIAEWQQGSAYIYRKCIPKPLMLLHFSA